MTVLLSVVALAIIFALAAVVVGREARRLDAVPPRPVFDLDEAVEWVAEHLPFEVSAVLIARRRPADPRLEPASTSGQGRVAATVDAPR